MQSACGGAGDRQICTTDTDCPAAFPSCQAAAGAAGGAMTCRAAMDAGAPPVDAAGGG
jgi:hypothetical protein